MLYLFCGIVFVIGLIAVKSEKKFFNPLTLFCIMWSSILFLSTLQLYSLYKGDNRTYKLMMIGVAAFIIGYYLAKLLVGNKRLIIGKKHTTDLTIEYQLNYQLMYVMLVVSLLFYAKDLVTVFSRLVTGSSLADIQSLVQGTDNLYNRSGVENAIRLLIINPFGWAIIPILAVDIWMGKKNRKLIVLTGLLMISRIFTTGGRAAFLNFAIYLIVLFFFTNQNKRNRITSAVKNTVKENKKLFRIMVAASVILLAYMTYSRAGDGAVRTIYFDFAMQPYLCGVWMDTVDAKNMLGYGMVSLSGFIFPIIYIVKNLLRFSTMPTYYQELFDLKLSLDTEWKWIGSRVYANAYVSAFWFLYVDARSIGIIVGMLVYGFVSRIVYNNTRRRTNKKNACLYALYYIGIFYTFVRFQFTTIDYAMAIVFVAFMAYRRVPVRTLEGEYV